MWWEEGPEPSVSHQQLLKWAESGSFQDFFGALQKEDDHVLSIRSQSGKTLLHLAAWGEGKGHDECVKALIERGADLNVRDDEGWAPIHMAAGIGSVNVVRMLIMHNANVDVPTFKGESALDRAILKKRCDIIKCLLFHGAKLKQEYAVRLSRDCLVYATRICNCKLASVVLIGLRKHRRSHLLVSQPKEIIAIIARHVFETRESERWGDGL